MPTARPIIEIRFGVKKLKSHSTPNRPTTPSVTAIAKIPITIGVSPATTAPNTTIRTMIAASTPTLAEAQVFLGDALEILRGAHLSELVGLDTVARVSLTHLLDLEGVSGGVVEIPRQHRGEQHRLPVLGRDRPERGRVDRRPLPPATGTTRERS